MPEVAEKFESWGIVEEWRAVPEFEGLYEVSSEGRVRRVGRAARTGKGYGGGARIGYVLKERLNAGGYVIVQLWRGGKNFGRLAHRLVAAAFLGPRPDEHDVNHLDGNKRNNAPNNLEYCTRSANNHHAYRTGLKRVGADKPGTKLTADAVREIRRAYAAGEAGSRKLARRFGVNRESVRQVLRGDSWAHLEN